MAQPVEDRMPPVEEAIRRRVQERARDWFPGTGTTTPVRLRRLVERPRAVLYAVHLDGGARPHLLAKVRRDDRPPVERGATARTRPRLAAGVLSPAELSTLEYAGLRGIQDIFAGDPRFGVVRPLDHLADHNTLLIEYVDAPTLRELVVRDGRLSPGRWRGPPAGTAEACRSAGAWLARFQTELPFDGRPERQATRASVVDAFAAYEEFLLPVLGRRALGDVVLRGVELAAQALPERLPLAVGHGDYAPRNMFVRADACLAVFDPLPRWVVPRYDDLSRLLVAIRMQALQVHTRGAAFSREQLDAWEEAVLVGYREEQRLSLPELRCYQLLITLDRWCALVDGPAAGWRGRLAGTSVRRASGYLRGEAERLLVAEPG
jgi:hypothetical protein